MLFRSYTNYVKLAENDNFYREIKVGDKIITENAITLTNGIQLITRHYGHPDTIRGTFDFVHCMPYYLPYFDKLYISKEQYNLNMNKKLKSHSDVSNLARLNKFLGRGWTWQ